MMVTFVSQCQKNAHKKTRRVLDAFADRIGDNTWQTVITQEGLQAVRKLLRKTASKNTAVSCHWIRSRSRSELVWVVGRRNAFDAQGRVPVNFTKSNQITQEQFSLNTEVIALAAKLSGLFHDIGKSTDLFQAKLEPEFNGKKYEPFKHEWVSLRIFQAFVGERKDRVWLKELTQVDNSTELKVLERLANLRDGLVQAPNPFQGMQPIAKLIAWLIVSHHKLPQYPKEGDNQPSLEQMDSWLDKSFEACWNSPQSLKDDWDKSVIEDNWRFSHGTLFKSALWQTNAASVADSLLRCDRMFIENWFEQRFTSHIARLCLMFADHYYSSQETTTPELQDRNYKAYANTDFDEDGKRYKKQKLDEHNIAVGINAFNIAYILPNLKDELPSVKVGKAFKAKVPVKYQADYGWQDKAYELACTLKDDTKKYGFFGICMASTGKGKTRANARIMYGLSEEGACRFSVALGLRTLTLQTGTALKKDLKLSENELALLIGSQAVKDLHQQSIEPETSKQQEQGSESAEALLKDEIALLESLPEYTGKGAKWFKHDPKILKLVQAPVLVSTIDYLMPANEGVRGGRQIAPMLRLLTSDLVLDEPDDFGLDDYPALCRLVNWAGMLGSRVLLSTATISPALASALFSAYQEGRKQYVEVNCEEAIEDKICCAWFDEFKKPQAEIIQHVEAFEHAHNRFVDMRITNLKKKTKPLRKAKACPIEKSVSPIPSQQMAETIYQSIQQLHQDHSIIVGDKKISIGLVRMANINPLTQVAKSLVNRPSPENTIIHYCVYHSQFPLLQRSKIEALLDKSLARQDHDEWIKQSGIDKTLAAYTQTQHIFVVLATAVAEVGRDHDYDWAIVEPSSMRSIIQLAGRVQRHRKIEPQKVNIHILSENLKGLKNSSKPSFVKPGFESKSLRFASNDLNEIVEPSELDEINAVARIKSPDKFKLTNDSPPRFMSFNELEHLAQTIRLKGSKKEGNHASLWWQHEATWCGELQRLQPFRLSKANDDFNIIFNRNGDVIWQKKQSKTYPVEYTNTIDISNKSEPIKLGYGVHWWSDFDLKSEVIKLMETLELKEEFVLRTFTHVSLRRLEDDSEMQWQCHAQLGIYKNLNEKVR